MDEHRIGDVVIAGGGTAGWMAAAALSQLLPAGLRYRLIVLDEISTIGVGEATMATVRTFNAAPGIEFVDWKCVGERYIQVSAGSDKIPACSISSASTAPRHSFNIRHSPSRKTWPLSRMLPGLPA